MRWLGAVLVGCAAILIGAGAAAAADGARLRPDPAFGDSGVLWLPTERGSDSTVIDAHTDHAGRVVALVVPSDWADLYAPRRLYRYTPSGEPDLAFGDAGSVDLPQDAPWTNFAIDSQDRIVAHAGNVDGMVLRLDASGAIDASFGSDGRFDAPDVFPGWIVVDASDRILLLQLRGLYTNHVSMAILRLTADGAPDAGFGNAGYVSLPPEGSIRVAIDPAGRIVQAQRIGDRDPRHVGRIRVSRLFADGSPDAAFGTGGVSDVETSEYAQPLSVLLDAQGRIVVTTVSNAERDPVLDDEPVWRASVLRLGPDGAPDLGWGQERRACAVLPLRHLADVTQVPSGDYLALGRGQDGTWTFFELSGRDGGVVASHGLGLPESFAGDTTRGWFFAANDRFLLGGTRDDGDDATPWLAQFELDPREPRADLEVSWKRQPERHRNAMRAVLRVRSRGESASARTTVSVGASNDRVNVVGDPVAVRRVPPLGPGEVRLLKLRVRVTPKLEQRLFIATVADTAAVTPDPDDIAVSERIPLRPGR